MGRYEVSLFVFSPNAGKCGPGFLRIQIYFPAFGLNTGRYEVSLHIQSECRKMRAKISPNTDIFSAFGLNTGIYLFIHFIYRRYTILVTYTEIRSISLYSVRMQENADQNISEYRHFLRSGFKRNVETIPDLSAAITQDVTAIREIKLL